MIEQFVFADNAPLGSQEIHDQVERTAFDLLHDTVPKQFPRVPADKAVLKLELLPRYLRVVRFLHSLGFLWVRNGYLVGLCIAETERSDRLS